MTNLRLDHTSVVVSDLESAKMFFTELGMECVGEADVRGEWVDRINAIDDLHCRIVMMKTADGSGQLELTQFSNPLAISPEAASAPPNALGLRSIMFEVSDVDAMVERLQAHGGSLVGEIVNYETYYRLCYLRGPDGIIVSLAEPLGQD